MLQPLVELNRRWIRLDGRIVAVIVTLLEVTVVIGGVIYMFLPSVVSEVNMMADIVKDLSSGRKPMPESYRRMTDILSRYFEPDNFEELFSLQHMDTLIRRGSSLVAESVGIVLHTLEWLLTLVYILFILIDYHQITRGFKLIIPGRYRSQVMSVVRDVESSMNRYFRGRVSWPCVRRCFTVRGSL